MEEVFYHLAEELKQEEMVEQDFPHLVSDHSIKEKIKREFNIENLLLISTEDFAQKMASNPLIIRYISTTR